MQIATSEWLAIALISVALAYGLLSMVFPILVIRSIMRLTQRVLKGVHPNIDQPNSYIYLLENNIDEFKGRYWYNILGVRVGGCFTLFIFSIGLILVIFAIIEV